MNIYAKGRVEIYGQSLYCPLCEELEDLLAIHKASGKPITKEMLKKIRKLDREHPRCQGEECGVLIGEGHLSLGPDYCNNCRPDLEYFDYDC